MQRKTIICLLLLSLFISNSYLLAADIAPNQQSSDLIQIDSSSYEGNTYSGCLKLQGVSSLEKLWICLQGPAGELAIYPAYTNYSKEFTLDLWLRFGPGTYYILASDNQQFFDGKVSIKVINTQTTDTRYTSPSAYVDSNNSTIQRIASTLITPQMKDYEKVEAIHQWIINNITYDLNAYLAGHNELKPASISLTEAQGLCRDYAFILAALGRAANIPVRVVYGQAGNFKGSHFQHHAWNEVYLDGHWISVDSCWNAGYIKNNRFISSPSSQFFDPNPAKFAETHRIGYYPNH